MRDHRVCLPVAGWPRSPASRAVPINPALLPILRQWRNDCPASDEALVFPTARGYMRQKDRDYGFKAALAGAECHAIGFYGLGHTFASHFMMSGGNILTLQKLLGHSSVAVTMKYAHLAPDFMLLSPQFRWSLSETSLRGLRPFQ